MRRLILLGVAVWAYANIFAGSTTKHSMDIKGDFAKTHQCIRCHLDIYDEYKTSPHFNSTIYRDPVHKKIFELHAKASKAKEYVCAKCHTPTLKDKRIASMDPKKFGYEQAISCAYCHRIKSIEKHAKANKNEILPKKGVYYGTRNPEVRSEYHKIINTNPIHKNGETCMGCHSHKQNEHGFVVCQTENNNTLKQNCITCHMPQVEGNLSDRVETPTHAFHGFAGVSIKPEFLAKYLHIDLIKKDPLQIRLTNDAPHAFLLHPLRLAKLIVKHKRGGKLLKEQELTFVRIIGKDGKPTPPWVATEVVKDTMLKAGEKRVVTFDLHPKKGYTIEIIFGFYKVNPKMAKKFGLPTKFIVFKKKEFHV
ncbi:MULTISPECIES: multiheme c-type cytochrome [unclassified Nitratiruptor]|uniref:multiheme c-type cytochrome n=1 Tax=unclassified Nitratiruptor TaxID=2624044 RepID=UPI001916938D|nr:MULTISPECIES: multiheme c-type cytochrome [unclassified Nitratiruptor]BCD60538.1 hypothetical protein NitYY0810_C1307 [Nitratiruptor sp. YY08-10]BCD63973.1 hypothetical protein NitYY0814_C0814 [Nitratiruptor sp. YY08-14]